MSSTEIEFSGVLQARGGVRLDQCPICRRAPGDHPFLVDLMPMDRMSAEAGHSLYSRVYCDGNVVEGWSG